MKIGKFNVEIKDDKTFIRYSNGESVGSSFNNMVIQKQSREMALALNGGDWDKDYTESQKIGWYLKVLYSHTFLNPRI